MARSTKTQKSLNLNAAHRLLSRGTHVTEAAEILSRECGISLRQAYRYLEAARAIGRAVPVAEPLVAATFKIPSDVLRQVRAHAATSGLTLSAILTRALKRYLQAAGRHRGKHG
jgi:predicted DNA-binding transcriptional regulator YafY